MSDLRFAVRQFRKQPGFTLVAVLTLALGIGANTAIFSVVNSVLIRPLPFPAADRILMIHTLLREESRTDRFETVFDPEFKEWVQQNRVFEQMAAYGNGQSTLLGGGEPERIGSAEVTVDFFALLGVKPLLGRTFVPGEHQAGGPQAAVLSEGLWRSRFGANPSIVGKAITLDGKSVNVVGVLPGSFNYPASCDVWTSLVLDTRGNNALHHALARLKTGVTHEQAQAHMDALCQAIAPAGAGRGKGVELVSLQEQIVGGTRSLLFVFLGAVGFVLLIACANVTNLVLARTAVRQKEIQIRVALGAGPSRIARHLLTESVLLAMAGGVAGLFVAVWGLNLLIALMPPNLVPRIDEVGLDVRVLGFNFTVSLITGVLLGLVPAWHASRTDANEALKEGGRSQSSGVRHRLLRQALMAIEVGVSIVLLVGAGLMLKSFARLREVKLGFDPEQTLTFNLSLPGAGYPNPERIKAFYREALDQVRALPGVRAAGIANAVPLGGGSMRLYGDFSAEGLPASATSWASKVAVSPDYFRTLGIPLLMGRFFQETDNEGSPGVAIINHDLARRLWPGGDPLGKRVQIGIGSRAQPWLEVVGVVGDVRQDELKDVPPPGIHIPYQQVSQTFLLDAMTVAVRATGDPRSLTASIRKSIHSIDPSLPVFDVHTMEEWVSWKMAHPRFNTWLLGTFSALALMLAIVGIYGVVSYGVSQRTQEIGIRLALGARTIEVLKLVVKQGMKPVLLGVLGGSVVAVILTRFLATQLYAVTPTDPVTFASVIVVFVVVALAACLVPAFGATQIDPVKALRTE